MGEDRGEGEKAFIFPPLHPLRPCNNSVGGWARISSKFYNIPAQPAALGYFFTHPHPPGEGKCLEGGDRDGV